ncbi:Histidine kinase-, DNA gyrase B-, and HSP90-like ATPase [Quadrisphaera granulorum]|uniref:Oxygen sensor histidine kinase NreB n=1 Tax=Quadrisphaera granulorum TaxID=317664 RepID=A0A316AEX9_9ACTN|nr:sensor histidine kinase [Quadrisphaera granulorum]PWJ56346.1 histidine kinase/DNA gyrase B/HSP90-like ATPase [Quadrisphaera granulorum]SZE94980.1 Histidine kinase-, DNA gyrase B-, and HSP90-like ATPase [Quadrisphaera granulorum]
MRAPVRPSGALVVAACAAALVISAVLDALSPTSSVPDAASTGWSTALTGLLLAVPGAVVQALGPRTTTRGRDRAHPVAVVLLLGGLLWAVDGVSASWLLHALTAGDGTGATAAFWSYNRLGAWLLLPLPLVLLLVHDGALPRGRVWRPAALVGLASTALLPVVVLGVPSSVVGQPPVPGVDLDPVPVPLPEPVWEAVWVLARALVPVSLLVPFALLVARSRGPAGPARDRSRWMLWSALVALLTMLTVWALPDGFTSAALTVSCAVVAASCAVALVRPDLVDVDRLLGGTLVWALVAGSVLVVDVVLVAAASALLGGALPEREAALVAVLLVTAVYGPLRERVWSAVRRLVLGDRDDPWHALSSLAQALERSGSAREQLLVVAESVAHAFRVDDVVVEVDRADGGSLVAVHGRHLEPDARRELPLVYRGEPLGRLLLPAGPGCGTGRSRLSRRDERLLGDLVRQAALAARAEALAEDLQASRARILAVREEDRRRVRRDLHDGLGPVLGAAVMAVDTVRNLAPDLPEPAQRMLGRVRDDVQEALAEVRRLVHELRPPALDDLGLVGALRQHADRLGVAGLDVSVRAAADLEAASLPAAVEVAAYRIAGEAVTNAARHARATRCSVHLGRRGSALEVVVDDDGRGIDPAAPAGVGLASLKERARELGGSCTVTCPPGGGTRVEALLPLTAIEPAVPQQVARA